MNKILQVFKIKDLRNDVLAVFFLLACFRVLAAIPIPGINLSRLRDFLAGNQLFGFLNIFSGGTLNNLSVVMLGVAPYITATIIMQLLTMIFPKFKEMYYEEGAVGRAKFNRYSRYLTVPFAGLQAFGFLKLLISQNVVPPLDFFDMTRNIVLVTAGTMILVWLGEMITERKIGNGISLIIFAGIVSGFPAAVQRTIFAYEPGVLPTYIAFVAVAILIITGVVFIQEGERKIPVAYAKRVRGIKMYGGVSSYLPIKVNQAGVIPIIFAISVLLFPQFLAQAAAIFSTNFSLKLSGLVGRLFENQYLYASLYFLLVAVFTYFYTAVTFDPKEVAKNLQRAGGFITGIRPGESTSIFLSKIISRVTFSGAIFLGLIAISPNISQIITGIAVLTIGGTALLIVISVALETARHLNSQLIMREYEGFQ